MKKGASPTTVSCCSPSGALRRYRRRPRPPNSSPRFLAGFPPAALPPAFPELAGRMRRHRRARLALKAAADRRRRRPGDRQRSGQAPPPARPQGPDRVESHWEEPMATIGTAKHRHQQKFASGQVVRLGDGCMAQAGRRRRCGRGREGPAPDHHAEQRGERRTAVLLQRRHDDQELCRKPLVPSKPIAARPNGKRTGQPRHAPHAGERRQIATADPPLQRVEQQKTPRSQ